MPWIRKEANGRVPSFDARPSALHDPYLTNIFFEHLTYHLLVFKLLHTIIWHTIFCPIRSPSYDHFLTSFWHTIFPLRTFPYDLLAYDLLFQTIIFLRTFTYEYLAYDLFLYELLLTIFCLTIFCPMRTFAHELLAYEHSAYKYLSCNHANNMYEQHKQRAYNIFKQHLYFWPCNGKTDN